MPTFAVSQAGAVQHIVAELPVAHTAIFYLGSCFVFVVLAKEQDNFSCNSHNGRQFYATWQLAADLKPSILGQHQLDTAHVVREQGLGCITHDTIIQGLHHTSLPGPLQVQHYASQQWC